MRTHNMNAGTPNASPVGPFEVTSNKVAVCIRHMVHVLYQLHPSLRAGFAMEWRRWYYRHAAAMVHHVHRVTYDANRETIHNNNESFGTPVPSNDPRSATSTSLASVPADPTSIPDKNTPTYLTPEQTKTMKTLLELPTDEDLNVVLSAAESLCRGTYSKVCGDPVHVADIAAIMRAIGVG